MGGTDLDALLREAGTTREEVIRHARAKTVDLAGTIHDQIGRLRDSFGVRMTPKTRTPEEFADVVQQLLHELLTELETLVVTGDVTLKDIVIDDIHPTAVAPYLTIAVRARLAALKADRTDDSPTARSSTRAALDIALNRVDRYVKGIARLFGHPIVDQRTDEPESQ